MGKSLRFVISIFAFNIFISSNAMAIRGNSTNPTRYGSQVFSGKETSPKAKSKTKKSEFDQEAQSCEQDAKEAAKQCGDQTNQNSQNAQNQSNNYSQQQQQSQGSSAGGGQGAQGECGGLGDLMKAIEPLLKQAGGECKAANEKCKSSCKKAQQGASKCGGVPQDDQAACQGDAQQNQQFGQKEEGACGAQDSNAMAFLAAAANAAMQAAQMAKCKKDTELDCSKEENKAKEECGGQELLNCALPKFAADPKCICQMNPRASGCPGSENPKDATRASKEKRDKSSPGSDAGPSTGSPSTSDQLAPKASSAGLPFSPAGGGGGGKGADSTKGPELGGAPKGMSADVLSGDYGGGGGGSKPGGGGYPDGDPRNGALAKAKKAADRRLASQGAWTGSMGRSNWDKIKERYRDNRPTLMNADR